MCIWILMFGLQAKLVFYYLLLLLIDVVDDQIPLEICCSEILIVIFLSLCLSSSAVAVINLILLVCSFKSSDFSRVKS